MKYYFAPMEGITGYVYRNAHKSVFNALDAYYMPFIAASHHHSLKSREKSDVNPANNSNINAIPQILSKNAYDTKEVIKQLEALGYKEVNINLGCPSPTVTKKGKGSAMLEDLDLLKEYLDELFTYEGNIKISIKSRIGYTNSDHVRELIELYNQYPIYELTIHPRTGIQMYNGTVDMDAFRVAYKTCRVPLVYNGDIKTIEDIKAIEDEFKDLTAIMLGRGLISRPYLVDEYVTGKTFTLEDFKVFHEAIVREYKKGLGADKDVLYKLKELWAHMNVMFSDSKKPLKHIRKSKSLDEYRVALEEMMQCHFH